MEVAEELEGEGSGGQRAAAGNRLGAWHDDATEMPVRTVTWDSWFQTMDRIVVPGRASDDEDDEDKKAFPMRFAAAVCGHGEGASGYARVSAERTKHKVAREYGTLAAYSCSICKRNVAGNVAMRPATESLRVFRAGPRVKEAPHNCELEDIHGVYTEEHEHQMLAAGYERINLRHHNPGLALPEGIEPLGADAGGSSRKKPRGASSMVALHAAPPPPPAHVNATPSVLTKLSMPASGVPGWETRADLIELMQKPFYVCSGKSRQGPFTPVYLWPSGKGKAPVQARSDAGAPVFTAKHIGALGRLFEDYYNLVVRENAVREHLRACHSTLFRDEDGNACDPLTAPGVNIPKFWRQRRKETAWSKPQGQATWRDAVLHHLRGHLTGFQEPFVSGEPDQEEED